MLPPLHRAAPGPIQQPNCTEVRLPMPSGRVKVFHPDRNFGFLTTEDGSDVYVAGDQVSDGPLHTGDLVEFEVVDSERGGKAATAVTVTKRAPEDSPVGRTMAPPPSWDELEERERQRRAARRRRR
jgi:cold shock protein